MWRDSIELFEGIWEAVMKRLISGIWVVFWALTIGFQLVIIRFLCLNANEVKLFCSEILFYRSQDPNDITQKSQSLKLIPSCNALRSLNTKHNSTGWSFMRSIHRRPFPNLNALGTQTNKCAGLKTKRRCNIKIDFKIQFLRFFKQINAQICNIECLEKVDDANKFLFFCSFIWYEAPFFWKRFYMNTIADEKFIQPD